MVYMPLWTYNVHSARVGLDFSNYKFKMRSNKKKRSDVAGVECRFSDIRSNRTKTHSDAGRIACLCSDIRFAFHVGLKSNRSFLHTSSFYWVLLSLMISHFLLLNCLDSIFSEIHSENPCKIKNNSNFVTALYNVLEWFEVNFLF